VLIAMPATAIFRHRPQARAKSASTPNASPKSAATAPPTRPNGSASEPRAYIPTKTERTEPSQAVTRSLRLIDVAFPRRRRAQPAGASAARDARQHNEGAYGGNRVSPIT